MSLLKFLPLLALIMPIATQNSHTFFKNEPAGYHMREVHNYSEQHTEKNEIAGGFRLPTVIEPISYFIRLQPLINGDRTIPGYTEIVFRTLTRTNAITLHMKDIIYDESSFQLTLLSGSGDPLPFTQHSYDESVELYTGTLDDPMLPNKEYRLTFKFQSALTDEFNGFTDKSYTNGNGEEVKMAMTRLQFYSARKVFPCFDEPSFKATFQMEIGREDSYTALSNTPKVSSRPIDGQEGWTWDLFDVTPIMSSYLVSVGIIKDFVKRSIVSETGVEFNIWSLPEMSQFADHSLDFVPRMLSFLEQYFEISYPLPKVDLIAFQENVIPVESYGLIPFGENILLWDPVLGNTGSKRMIDYVTSHYMAHQFNGNYATPEWWNHLWLSEGMAAFFSNFVMDAVNPSMEMMVEFPKEKLQGMFNRDSKEGSYLVVGNIASQESLDEILTLSVVWKGAICVRMMYHFLTPETFRLGMKNYLQANAFENTVSDYLFKHLNDQAKKDNRLPPSMNVKDIMDTWVLQEGYPLITVTINGDGTATLSQERYMDPAAPSTNERYWVPITFASDTINPNFDSVPMEWMSPSDSEITISGLSPTSTWHIFNTQQAYFYRVNYDEASWYGIVDQLVSDYSSIDVRNRVQLLDDSISLAETGVIPFDIPLFLASYLNNEDHFIPFQSFYRTISYYEKMLSTTVASSTLRKCLRRLTYPAYDLVGAVDGPSDDYRTIMLRDEIVPWACHLLNIHCMDSASQQFAEWMANPDDYTIISPNLKASIYCTAVREGREEEWNFALDRYEATPYSNEKEFLLSAMACTEDRATLYDYLNLIYNGSGIIPKSSAFEAFSSISVTDTGRDIAWDYLVNNYHKIADFHGSYETVQELAEVASREFNTNKDYNEIIAFRNDLRAQAIDTEIIDYAIDTVEYNIGWMERNYDAISSWLFVNC